LGKTTRSVLSSVVCVCFLGDYVVPPACAQPTDLLTTVKQTIGSLSPVAVGLQSLVDDAIAKGNQALADRLSQLQAIINGALFSLQTMINYGIDKLDTSMQSQLRVLNANAQQLVAKFSVLSRSTLEQAQSYLQDDLDKLQSTFGNSIAQINFLNTTPILNVPKDGFSLIQGKDSVTYMYITGVGMTKADTTPDVKLLRDKQVIAGVPVKSQSMPLLKISIPSKAISQPSADYSLSFRFCTGINLIGIKQYTDQEFPLRVCKLPRFTITTKLWSEGQDWRTEIRNLNQGSLAGGIVYGVQCPRGNGKAGPLVITAQAFPGWELYDPGWGRLINCIRNSANGYTDMGYQGPSSCWIYVDGRDGDAHLNVTVQIAERQRITKTECAAPFVDRRELHGTIASSFEFSRAQLNGTCDTGLVLKAIVTSSEGDAISDLTGILADGQVAVSIGDGIVTLKSTPHCREQPYGNVVVLPH